MSQVVPSPCAHINYFNVQLQPIRLGGFENTHGKVVAGVANSGAGAGTGAGAGAGAVAAGVLLECCVTFPTKRCPSSSISKSAIV